QDRSVLLSWDRNSEPDLTGLPYQIWRKGPNEKDFTIRAVATQPSGKRGAVLDDTTRSAGGDYIYHLVAVRTGATGDSNSTAASAPTKDVKVTVAAPPPGSAPPATQPPPSGPAAAPPALRTSSGTSNLSRISTSPP